MAINSERLNEFKLRFNSLPLNKETEIVLNKKELKGNLYPDTNTLFDYTNQSKEVSDKLSRTTVSVKHISKRPKGIKVFYSIGDEESSVFIWDRQEAPNRINDSEDFLTTRLLTVLFPKKEGK
jgi:hypothetical protein